MSKTNKQINKDNEMSDNSPDSPAVIAYRLREVEKAVSEGNKTVADKLDSIVTNFSTKADMLAVIHRVASLENDRKWIVRLVVGAVVFSLMALIGLGFKLNT